MSASTPSPLSTYRLQCHAGFTLDDARGLVPYFRKLGVTHLYLSPVLSSRSGSTHGYDGVDPRAIDLELGGREALERLAGEAHRQGLGILVDTVPNHLATSFENPAWRDVLTHGCSSPWARWFDIDWDVPDADLRGRILCPVLGGPVDEVIGNGELAVAWEGGRFVLCYYDHRFPLTPSSVPLIATTAEGPLEQELAEVLEGLSGSPDPPAAADRARRDAAEEHLDRLAALADDHPEAAAWLRGQAEDFGAGPGGPARMRGLLARQAYLLTAWQEASRRINYRRFFDINELVCVRQEDPAVFAETHATLLELVAAGHLDGLRIDHVDGLRDPLGYFQSLRAALHEARPDKSLLLFVEKILAEGEELPEQWPVDGTTGYEFLNQVEQWLVNREGFEAIETFYRDWIGSSDRFHAIADRGKRRVLRRELQAPAAALARELATLGKDADLRMDDDEALDAVVEIITALPVYRTYADGDTTFLGEAEARQVRTALKKAVHAGRATPEALGLLGRVLLLDGPGASPPEEWIAFVQRFQQLSGPAAAKGIEDTALYAYAPLASLNEVGGEPVLPAHDPDEALHQGNRERARRFPRGMLAVSTHDTKRSADVRARLDVLSEIPERWCDQVRRWHTLNAAHRAEADGEASPGPAAEFLFYQSLLALWPIGPDGAPPSREGLSDLEERLVAYMEKAAREAKRRTSWTDPDPAYETALTAFVRAALAPENRTFLEEVHELATVIGPAGWWNALAQTVLHLTSPGSPDVYQGDELWELSLVDPDNRRPVDYGQRAALLEELARERSPGWLADLGLRPADPRLKLHVVHALLAARRRLPELFGSTDYRPLDIEGDQGGHLVAFLRTAGREVLLVVVSRHLLGLSTDPDGPPVGGGCWREDTRVVLPEEISVARWDSLLGGAPVEPRDPRRLPVARLLAELPVAVCHAVRR